MKVGTGGQGYGGVAAIMIVLVAAALFATGCGGSSSGSSSSFNGSGYPNGDPANTRNAGGPIKSSTVNELDVAWSLPIEAESAFGSYASPPILSKGVVYSQDLASNVQAIDAGSGDVLWTKKYEMPDHGPNGVVVQEGLVFGATPAGAFALDQETGKQVWSTNLIRNEQEGVDMAPGYHDGIVYVSTVPVNVGEFYGAGLPTPKYIEPFSSKAGGYQRPPPELTLGLPHRSWGMVSKCQSFLPVFPSNAQRIPTPPAP